MHLNILLLLIAGLLVNCKSGSRDLEDDDDTSIRSGKEIPVENQETYDAKVALSADGTKLVFISGRDGDSRVYKFETSDKQPSRVTEKSDDIDSELETVISPDGAVVAMIGDRDGVHDVFVKKFDGSDAAVQVDDDQSSLESHLSFSDDGALITFVRHSNSAVGAKVWVAQVSTEGEVSNLTQLTDSNGDEDYPTFIATGVAGTYKLLTVKRETTGFSERFFQRTLSLGGGINVDAEATLTANRRFSRSRGISGGFNNAYFSTDADASGEFANESWTPLGDESEDESITVQSVLAELSTQDDDVTKLGDDLGVSVLSVSAAKVDGGAVVTVTRDVWSCEADKLKYVTSLKIIDSTDGSAVAFNPEYKDQEFVGPAETLCLEKDNKETKLDTAFLTAVINDAATANNYAVAFVSLYPEGDTEVRLLSYDGSDYTLTDVSQNEN